MFCQDCPIYSPWDMRILIIKLDAAGDVLRSTCILPGLKNSYPESCVVWMTRAASAPLLANNPFIDEVVVWNEGVSLRLAVETFDLVLSLDSSPGGAHAATYVSAPSKLGFGCNENGKIIPLNTEAEEWFMMGCFDPIKKANCKSYPQILHEICRLPWKGDRPVLRLNGSEECFAGRFAEEHLRRKPPVIGLFTGAGRRWLGKSWTAAGFSELVELILGAGVGQILLLGGADEAERNQRLLERFSGRIIDGGCNRSLREFVSLVSLCDLLVTADTLALHVATALEKKFVALVGPTSAAEIETYESGMVLQPQQECQCYYHAECHHSPSCMELLPAAEVFAAVRSLL